MSLENFVQEKVKTELVKAGINIDHGTFGKGIVKSVDGQIVTVDFGKNGVRKLSKLFIEKLIGK